MTRTTVLSAAVVMQMCLGGTYAWAVFVGPIKGLTGFGQGAAQVPFTVFYTVFPITAVIAGSLMHRIGLRRAALCGGAMFGLGWMVAGFGAHGFAYTVMGVGVLGGIGAGLAYLVPISVGVLWFPTRKGLVTGLAVAGFGGGAALVAQAGQWLMTAHALTPFAALLRLGTVFVVVASLAAIGMRAPADAAAPSRRPARMRELLASGRFRVLYVAMFSGLVAGFAVNANLKELATSVPASVGVAAVGFFAAGNALGRIVWGWLFDRRGHPVVAANLFIQAAVVACGPWLLEDAAGLTCFAALSGFNYGGVLVLYAASVARHFGTDRVASVYGWLFSANVPASAAPMLAGFLFDRTGSFTLPLLGVAVLLVAAAVVLMKPAA